MHSQTPRYATDASRVYPLNPAWAFRPTMDFCVFVSSASSCSSGRRKHSIHPSNPAAGSATIMKFSAFFPLSFLITCTSGRFGVLAIQNVAGVVTQTPSPVPSPESTPSSPPHVHHFHHVHRSNYRRVPRRWVSNRPDRRVVRPPSLNKRLSPTRIIGPYPGDLDTQGPFPSPGSSQQSQSELTNQTVSSLGSLHQTTPSDQNIPQFFQRTNEQNASKGGEKNSFTITQVRNPNFNEDDDTRNGLLAMMHAYAKYGTNMTSAIRLAMRLNPAFQRLTKRRFPLFLTTSCCVVAN